jgi:hypothetical protein
MNIVGPKSGTLHSGTQISNLNITEQNYYRSVVARNVKDISREDKTTNKKNKEEWKQVKNKMEMNKLTITEADKGKTLVILTQEEYIQNK